MLLFDSLFDSLQHRFLHCSSIADHDGFPACDTMYIFMCSFVFRLSERWDGKGWVCYSSTVIRQEPSYGFGLWSSKDYVYTIRRESGILRARNDGWILYSITFRLICTLQVFDLDDISQIFRLTSYRHLVCKPYSYCTRI